RSDSRVQEESRSAEIVILSTEIGLSLATTPTLPSPTFQAASGHEELSPSAVWLKSKTGPGELIRCATHRATGTDTALPSILRRGSLFGPFWLASFVQPGGNPWSCSHAGRLGMRTSPSGRSTAGADGMPKEDPTFNGGIPSIVSPIPDLPSVQ